MGSTRERHMDRSPRCVFCVDSATKNKHTGLIANGTVDTISSNWLWTELRQRYFVYSYPINDVRFPRRGRKHCGRKKGLDEALRRGLNYQYPIIPLSACVFLVLSVKVQCEIVQKQCSLRHQCRLTF